MTLHTRFAQMLTMALLTSPAFAGVELDVEVGRTTGGELAFPAFDFGKVLLEPIGPNPFGLEGWSGDNPGWAAEGAPEGLEALEPGAEIWVEVLSLSPALRMLDPNAGLADIPAGGSWELGGDEFDAHPLWFIDSEHPAFDPEQNNWFGTFRLIDMGTTAYQPSAVHEFRFGIVPEPAAGTLLIAMALVAARLRRGR